MISRLAGFFILLIFISCKTTTYYIVRHAEKQPSSTNNDPLLSAEGEKQALALNDFMASKKIKKIYSTDYNRTRATAEPLRQALGTTVILYDPKKNDELIANLKKESANVLVVGHSNTVDDIINGLMGENRLKDLPDTVYGDIFIVKKTGHRFSFSQTKLPSSLKPNN